MSFSTGRWYDLDQFIGICFNEDMDELYSARSYRESARDALTDFARTQPREQLQRLYAQLQELLAEPYSELELEQILDKMGNAWDFRPYRPWLEGLLNQIGQHLDPLVVCSNQPPGSTTSGALIAAMVVLAVVLLAYYHSQPPAPSELTSGSQSSQPAASTSPPPEDTTPAPVPNSNVAPEPAQEEKLTVAEPASADESGGTPIAAPAALSPAAPPDEPVGDSRIEATENYERALRLEASRQLDDAVPLLDRAIQLNPAYAEAHAERGAVLGYRGNCEEAIQAFNRAIDLNPRIASWYTNRGNCFWNLKNIDLAIRDYNLSISIDGAQPEAFAKRGMAYGRINKLVKSEADLREAIRLGHRDPSTFHNLGFALYGQGRYMEAIQFFSQAIVLKPDFALAFRYRGMAKQAIGRASDALVDLQRAQSLGNKD